MLELVKNPAPTMFKPPLTPKRGWEDFIEPDANELAEYMAQPYTRIDDASGNAVFNADDLFEFRPGHAEAITAAVNSHADLVDALISSLPFLEDLDADTAYKQGVVQAQRKKVRAALAKAGAI